MKSPEPGGGTAADPAARGWDQATRRCGADHSVTAEDAFLQAVAAHTDAHAVWDRLNPIERDGFTSILRVILSVPDLGVEFLVIADRMKARAEGGTG